MITEFVDSFGACMMFLVVLVLNECLCFCFKKYSDKFKEKSLGVAIVTLVSGLAAIVSGISAGIEFQILFGLAVFNLVILVFIIFRALKLEITIN